MTVPGCATSLESSIELLRTIASVLDIRTVFPRVSEIANRVVPHDLLTMTFHETGGEILIEAASTDELHDLGRLARDAVEKIGGDPREHRHAAVVREPADREPGDEEQHAEERRDVDRERVAAAPVASWEICGRVAGHVSLR